MSEEKIQLPVKLEGSTAAAVTRLLRTCKPPFVMLAGGSDYASGRVRAAQASIRVDGMSSYWSHVALVEKCSARSPTAGTGIEVTISGSAEQLPEKYWRTSFKLGHYLNRSKFPNFCVIGGTSDAWTKDLAKVARGTAMGDTQTPTQIAAWLRYSIDPRAESPVLHNIAHPGAAAVDMMLTAAGIDLTPSAATLSICPEHIWSSVRYFREGISDGSGELVVVSNVLQKLVAH